MKSVDAGPILDLLEAFRRSKTMFAALSLGVFDELHSGPEASGELAKRLKCNSDALKRLLNACVGLGLLSRAGDKFSNTEVSAKYLAGASPDTLSAYIRHSDQSLYRLWEHLDDAVREGTNRWEQTFGAEKGLFDHFFRTEDAQRSFLNGMHGYGRLSSADVIREFDLSPFRSVADLGGATGHLCLAACEAYSVMSGIILDLPGVKKFAEEHIANSPAAGRVRFVGGDFFNDELPGVDLYCVSRILHDWDEAKVKLLIGRMFAALPSGGGLLIAERLMADDHLGPLPTLMQDLNMLVCTDGRERTCLEYRSLLAEAGFHRIQCRPIGTVIDAILARKP